MGNIIGSVGRFFNAANGKADQLTTIAKGELCLPSIVTGLPALGKGLVSGALSQMTSILGNAVSTITSLVTTTIEDSINAITGSITGVIDTAVGLVSTVASVIKQAEEFKEGIKDRVTDVKDFTSKKENCNFAAAALLNCIQSQALSEITTKEAVNVKKGLSSVTNFANKTANKITASTGAIDRAVTKQAASIDRASRVIEKSNIF